MALVKKGSRLITVDGTTYRWRLRGRPTYDQGLVWSPLTYAVAHAGTPGTTLVVTTNHPHPSNWLGTQGRPILPGRVADSIRTALRDGWTPESPGSPFHLDQSAGFGADEAGPSRIVNRAVHRS
ncbi:hypothetical protein [Streptomyces racemochromogenes]|uniref:hypothetical protein n=1 Tax=Streptomyces racemochromogenes TaxID=67353 RepID=UPI0035E8CC4A